MNWNESFVGFFTALSIGLLIGTVRERLHKPGVMKAGVRTHAIVSLLGAIAFSLGEDVFIAALLAIGLLNVMSYHQSAPQDPGMTGEVALNLTMLLSALATKDASLAAGIGVIVAGLLYVKKPLRKFSQELLTEHELEDALMLFASTLVVLPLLPTTPIDPWNALNPYAMWKIVVLIMSVGMVGHICMRTSGVAWGLSLAGFFSGFISSTAAIAEFGRKAHEKPELELMTSAAALLSVMSSLALFTLVLSASAPQLMLSVKWPLMSAGAALLMVAVVFMRSAKTSNEFQLPVSQHAFKASHALLIAATISVVSLCSAWLRGILGDSGTVITSAVVGLVEIHAAAVSIAQLSHADVVQSAYARWGVIAILASSAFSKIFLAYISGGKNYGNHIATGLGAFILAAVCCMVIA